MKLLPLILLVLTCFFALPAIHAQENSAEEHMVVKGTVYDTSGVRPVQSAVVMAIRLRDSLLLSFQRTDAQGKFDLKGVPLDTFSLVIAHPDFDDKSYFIIGSPENREIVIPVVRMLDKAQEEEEVVIYAHREPIYYKGDTLVYVADSFQVGQNAVVEDLLKKLPGIEIDKDGKIRSQGKEVSQVLVDGDEFFGSDPSIATKNLGANGVQSVQVYEKKNENAAEGEDETIQVLDLKLKEDAKKGYFGRASMASDFNRFYEGELLANKFNKRQKISVFALGSNTPRSSFGYGDLNKFGLDNERSGGFDDGFGNTYYGGNNTSGIPRTFKAGVYYSEKFGKSTSVNFNYSYYNVQNDAYSASRSQYFLNDTTYYTNDSTRNQTFNEQHSFNLTIETNLDSLTKLTIRPRLNLLGAQLDNADLSDFLNQDNELTRNTSIYNTNESNGFNSQNDLRLNRKFKKPKREFDLFYQFNIQRNASDGFLHSYNTYYDTLIPSDTLDQSKINEYNSQVHRVSLQYYEPLGKLFKLSPQYIYEYGNDVQDKETYNRNGTEYTDFVPLLSNNFENTRQKHYAGMELIYDSRKFYISAGAFARNIDIDNHNLLSDTTIHQNVTNFLPEAKFIFKPTQATRFQIRYSTNSQQPSINDLQPVPDNTNPNRVRVGNPNLLPNYSHTINGNFNTWQALSGKYLWSGFWLNVTNRAFSSSVDYDQFGRQVSQTVNVDGNYNASVWFGGGLPFYKKLFTFRPQFNGNTFRNLNYINGQENITINTSLSPTLALDFDADSVSFMISGDLTYNIPKSSVSSVSNQPYYSSLLYAGFSWTLPFKMKIESEVTYNINSRRSAGYNINYLIWNAAIRKYFLKTENLELSLLLNDILNQNINNQRQISQNIITDNRTKIISRYFLLKLTLRFNNNKTKEEDANGWH